MPHGPLAPLAVPAGTPAIRPVPFGPIGPFAAAPMNR